MTDSDRLRQAADSLDDTADKVHHWSNEDMPMHRRTAAMLRAVEVGHGVKCWCRGDLIIDKRCAAALALADVILGGES